MKIEIKRFEELNTTELYAILRLRSEVFVVEQNCVYQDIDAKDEKALHLLGTNKGELAAYTRIFKAGDYAEKASIGRVVVDPGHRGHGYGYEIMKASLKAVKENIKEDEVEVSAQTYLKDFYNSLGFSEVGEGYLEDGIPHIRMLAAL
ncbi:GNAT family N-acetyltransferase [Poritiphilus flavus]|uniref:GNAT family N-acetyltransferase n=1 Tax=Poritiphilus flavus TaxID=2697053 RepID=A0A6L9E8H3_9FLAO|nr:GNAT family N-acetyltransferase [Poritiphilus flavus]NAS11016.1 GNAT family N-acetyltransferase [Poritiphilus flavus]